MVKALQKYDYDTGLEEQDLLRNNDIPDSEITISKLADLPEAAVDEEVKASDTDTVSGKLWDKIEVGNDLVRTITNPEGNEKFHLTSIGRFRVTTDDADYGYGSEKIIDDGELIECVVINPGANEKLKVKTRLFSNLTSPILTSPMLFVVEQDGIKKQRTGTNIIGIIEREWTDPPGNIEGDANIFHSDAVDVEYSTTFLEITNSNFLKNKRGIWGFGDSHARCLGRLAGIGRDILQGDFTEDELIQLRGSTFVISAADYSTSTLNEQCWFSINPEAVVTVGKLPIANYFHAVTNKVIDFVINAVFELHYVPGAAVNTARWVLKNYETMKEWFKKYHTTISYSNYNNRIYLPDDTERLPFDGYYFFEANIELVCDFAQTETTNKTILYDSIVINMTDADGLMQVEKTPAFAATLGEQSGCPAACCCIIAGEYHVYHLKIFGQVHITSDDCSGRRLQLDINFPATAAATPIITAINYSYVYRGKKEGHWCNEYA